MLEFAKPNWQQPHNVTGVTTQRKGGGISNAPYDCLNLGDHVGDVVTAVQRNRQLLAQTLDLPSEPVWLRQEHTNLALNYNSQSSLIDAKQNAYDAIYTQERGVVCCVMTADCMPLLVCNRAGTEVAAIHAGWRGMAGNIIENTLNLFETPLEDCMVWAGPTISQAHFEVGIEVREQLGGDQDHYQQHPSDENKCYADLYGLAKERVESLNADFYQHSACTYHDEEYYFSYRRDGITGRMASLIWIN